MAFEIMRTALFAPGTRPDRVDKAVATSADVVIIDLEDAVPPEHKAEARQVVAAKLAQHPASRLVVRCNALDTEFFADDLAALAGLGLACLFVPKVEEVEGLAEVEQALAKLERSGDAPLGATNLLCLLETARGVANAWAITSHAATLPRACMVAFGAADYAADMGIELTADGAELSYPRAKISNASHAAGLAGPLDSPYMYDLKDLDLLRAEARLARSLGFAGKLCIHPNQIDICNQVFSPTPEEVAFAQMVIEAFEQTRESGQGVLQVKGKFIDKPVVERCQRILALHQAAEAARG